jgi:hypothetical protein
MKLKHYVTAAVLLAWTALTGPAYADSVLDNINGGATPEDSDVNNGLGDVGWVYVPTFSYTLDEILTNFGDGDGLTSTVTLSFYSGIPNSGGTLLGTESFTSNPGFQGALFGSDISITAGDTYFVGLSNTLGDGLDMVAAAFSVTLAQPAAPGVTYTNGVYTDDNGATTDFNTFFPLVSAGLDNAFAAPILDFDGPNLTPEPGSLALSITGCMALLLGLSWKHRAASRRLGS